MIELEKETQPRVPVRRMYRCTTPSSETIMEVDNSLFAGIRRFVFPGAMFHVTMRTLEGG